MKSYADYVPFATDDFLSDPAFRGWIASPTPEMTAYWRGLLHTHPHLRASFEQARLLAQGLQATWIPFSTGYTDGLYDKLRGSLPLADTPPPIARPRWTLVRSVPRWAYTSAASVAVLLAGFWAYQYAYVEQQIQTGNAQLQTVTLPDGSAVTLGANSRLRVPGRLAWQTNRQVWLTGEGSFAVQKVRQNQTRPHRKFTVHTHRTDVAVLGTHFTVYTRPRRTEVLLEEGRVELTDPTTHQTLTMKPGEVVAYVGATGPGRRVLTGAGGQRPLTAWRENLLVFNNAGMDELTERFREVYGLQLMLRGSAFTGQQFKGELPVTDADKALLIVSETFGLKAVRDENRVYFVPE